MKSLLILITLSLSFFSFQSSDSYTSQENIQPEFINCNFTYSTPNSLCNTTSDPCRGVNFNISNSGVDVQWDFGPYACSITGSEYSPTVTFDTEAIFNATGQHGTQTVTVTLYSEDHYGNYCQETKTISFLVC